MILTINNQLYKTEAKTLKELAEELELPERGIALAINNSLVSHVIWDTAKLEDGDIITMVKATYGG